MKSIIECDVCIIGCGPVGALTSALFRAKHLRILSLERDPSIYAAPRAVSMDDVAVRLHGLVRPELVQWVDNHTLKSPFETRSGPPPIDGHDNFSSFSLVGPNPARLVPETGFHDIVFFHQPTYEARLRHEAFGDIMDDPSARKGGSLDEDCPRLQFCEVTNIVTGSAGSAKSRGQRVLITAKDKSGSLFQISARFVLASDGASSFVRKSLEIPFVGTSYPDEKWLVVDVATSDPQIAKSWLNFNFICDPNRILVHCPLPGRQGMRRFEFLLKHDEIGDSMNTPSNVKILLESIGVKYSDVTIIRSVIYTFHARRAQTWRSTDSCFGRVLLLGDAAHAMPPFRGQGMCTGLRDSANLSWKIRHCCDLSSRADEDFSSGGKGKVKNVNTLDEGSNDAVIDTLLQSYQIERESQVAIMVDVILVMGRMIMVQNSILSLFRNLIVLIPERIPFTKGWFVKDMFTPPIGYNIGLFDFSHESSCAFKARMKSERLSADFLLRDKVAGMPMPNHPVYSLDRSNDKKDQGEVLAQWSISEKLDDAIWHAIQTTVDRKKLDQASPPWIVLLSPKYISSLTLSSILPSNNGPPVVAIQVLPAAGSHSRMDAHRRYIARFNDGVPVKRKSESAIDEPWFSRADEAVADATNSLSTWFDAMNCAAVVVRPDLIVYGAYSESEWELGARHLSTLFSGGQLKIQNRMSYTIAHIKAAFIYVAVFACVLSLLFVSLQFYTNII